MTSVLQYNAIEAAKRDTMIVKYLIKKNEKMIGKAGGHHHYLLTVAQNYTAIHISIPSMHTEFFTICNTQ